VDVADKARDQTEEAKDEIVKQIEEQSKRINKQLSKHDINHKITQKHILHTAGPVPPAEGWIKKNYKSEWEDAVAEGYYESQPSRRRLVNRPKSHCTVLEAHLEEINRLTAT